MRKRFFEIILLFSVAFFVLAPLEAKAQSMRDLWRQGDTAFAGRRYDLAADYYLKALALSKSDLHTAQLANNLFYVYKTTLERAKALRFFRVSSEAYQKEVRSTSDTGRLARLHLLLGILHMENVYEEGEYLKAEEHLRNALRVFASSGESGPRKAETLYRLAMVLGGEGRDHEALRTLREAVSIDPENPLYTYKLGCAFVILSDARNAASTLRRLNEMEGEEASRHAENLAGFAAAMGMNVSTMRRASEKPERRGTGVLVGDFETIAVEPEAGEMAGSFVRSALVGLLDGGEFRVLAVADLEELDYLVDGSLSSPGRGALVEARLVRTATFQIVAAFSEPLPKRENLPAVSRKLAAAIAEQLKKEVAGEGGPETGESIVLYIDPKGGSESYLFTWKMDGGRFNVWVKSFHSTPQKKREEGERLGFADAVETAIFQYVYDRDGRRYALASEKYFNIRNEMMAMKTPPSLQWEPVRYGELPHVMYLAAMRKQK